MSSNLILSHRSFILLAITLPVSLTFSCADYCQLKTYFIFLVMVSFSSSEAPR